MAHGKMTPKASRTKQLILDKAYKEFSRKGYEATTMRAIAEKAGIAVGGIYHYFPSKEHMVQEYYRKSHEDHELVCLEALALKKKFEQRLHFVMKEKIEQALPYKNLASVLFRVAADPDNPLSPFSDDSRETRLRSLSLFKEIVEGSEDKIPLDFKKVLPEYLWLYQMGIILFWIHDKSEGSKNTFKLIDKSTDLIQYQVSLITNPLFSPFKKKILKMLISFKPNLG